MLLMECLGEMPGLSYQVNSIASIAPEALHHVLWLLWSVWPVDELWGCRRGNNSVSVDEVKGSYRTYCGHSRMDTMIMLLKYTT